MGPRHICLVTETFPPEINGVANTLDNLCRELRFQWSVNERQLAVLYVGRLAAEKNLAQAISTSERLKLIHAGARFILVGDGPLREKLQHTHPDYLFCGIQTGEALARHYASADIFLFPSQSETFGNVVLEAMASGLGVTRPIL
jgi:glycosyltransferase involved in cell wall biosynthesis